MYLRGFIYGLWGWAKGPWLCLMATPFLICLVFLCFCIVLLLSLIKFSLWISERPSMLKFSYKQDVGDTRVSPWEGSAGSYWVSVSQFYISCILSQDTLQLIVEWCCMLCCAVFSRSVVFDSCDPMACSPCPWDSPPKNTGMDRHALLQGVFPTQGSNPGLLNCRQIL